MPAPNHRLDSAARRLARTGHLAGPAAEPLVDFLRNLSADDTHRLIGWIIGEVSFAPTGAVARAVAEFRRSLPTPTAP